MVLEVVNGLTHTLDYWLANPIVPVKGQQCLISDLNLYKTGDGLNNFNALPFDNLPPVSIWFSTYQNIPSLPSVSSPVPTTFELKTLLGGTLVQEGGKATFEFTCTPVNNGNAKTIKVYFKNTFLLSYSVAASSAIPVSVKGWIKCIDWNGGKALCSVSVNGAAPTLTVVLGINFSGGAIFQVTGSGTAAADLTYNGGDGILLPILRFVNE